MGTHGHKKPTVHSFSTLLFRAVITVQWIYDSKFYAMTRQAYCSRSFLLYLGSELRGCGHSFSLTRAPHFSLLFLSICQFFFGSASSPPFPGYGDPFQDVTTFRISSPVQLRHITGSLVLPPLTLYGISNRHPRNPLRHKAREVLTHMGCGSCE